MGGGGDMASLVLGLSMKVNGQLLRPGCFISEKSPWYPLDRRLGGPQSRSGRCGEEKNLLPLPGIEPQFLNRPVYSPVAIDVSIDMYHNIRFCLGTGRRALRRIFEPYRRTVIA
jgi:hypothetical protein